jgi:hypothetical protein
MEIPDAQQVEEASGIVAVCFGALGDFLLTLPFLKHVCGGRVPTFVTRGAYRALLPASWTDSVFVDIDSADGARLFAGAVPSTLSSRLDGAVCHVFSRPDPVLSRAFTGGGAHLVVWHNPKPAGGPHIVEQFFRNAGISPPVGLLSSPVLGGASEGACLWLHPGSGSLAKNCPAAFFAALARGWAACHDGAVTVSFGDADLDLIGPVRRAFADRQVPFRERVCPSLAELREELARCAALFVGNDTGVTHLAAALGVPVIACFRSTDPVVWRPVGRCVVLP